MKTDYFSGRLGTELTISPEDDTEAEQLISLSVTRTEYQVLEAELIVDHDGVYLRVCQKQS